MRFVLGFFSIFALLIVGLLLAPSFIDWSQYKDKGLAQVKELTGYDIQIDGDFGVAFLPSPRATAARVKIINP